MLVLRCLCFIALLVAVTLMARSFLILFGRIKEPILHTFEHYGEEIHYSPVYQLILRLVAVSVCIELLISTIRRISPFIPGLTIMLLVVLGYIGFSASTVKVFRHVVWAFPVFPLWYRDVLSRTSRYERRRISYLWYRLPAKTRSAFNWSDELFIEWVDFVVMGAVMEEDAASSPLKPGTSSKSETIKIL